MKDVTRLGYRPALDGVRGLAIAPVVTMHAFGWPREGMLGVELFFVLSGFLITSLLLEERVATGTISFRAFYRRRAARLLPALFVMLAAYELATHGAHPWVVLAAVTYTSNLVAQAAPSSIPLSLGHLWSLAQEEQFYLLWPPLLLLILRKKPVLLTRVLCTLITLVLLEKTILLATGASLHRIFAPDANASPILIGCLFGVLYAGGRAPKLGRRSPLALAVILGILLAAQLTYWFQAESPVRPLFSFAAGFLILAAVEGQTLLTLAPLRFLGRISYSLYLWHAPVLVALGATVSDGRPLRSVLGLVAAIAAASASFHFVERPLRARWRKQRPSQPRSAPDASVPAMQPGRP
jgi:peptidoglycan/LPS O-acetylase OafA/YrhL